jgi:hypothetical protein
MTMAKKLHSMCTGHIPDTLAMHRKRLIDPTLIKHLHEG